MTIASQALVVVVVAAGLFVIIRLEMFVLADLAHRPDSELRFLPRAGRLAVCLLTIPFGASSTWPAGATSSDARHGTTECVGSGSPAAPVQRDSVRRWRWD